jgi:hypothetical protein
MTDEGKPPESGGSLEGFKMAPQEVSDYLRSSFASWNRVEEFAADWANMAGDVQEGFHCEWSGITETRLRRLGQAFQAGQMTTEEQHEYAELLRLVEKHRPLLQRMLDSDHGTPIL